MIDKFKKLFPVYAWLPLILLLAWNLLVFYGTRPINAEWHHYDLTMDIDRALPFVPMFMFIYVLAFAQWGISFVAIGRESREICGRFYCGEMIAKTIALVFFLAMPTTMTRPQIVGNGLGEWLTRLIYSADTPTQLFPSIHCLFSWFCFRGALRLKKVPSWFAPAELVMTLLVFASVLLVKQHVFADVISGILVFELGLWLSGFAFPETRKGGRSTADEPREFNVITRAMRRLVGL